MFRKVTVGFLLNAVQKQCHPAELEVFFLEDSLPPPRLCCYICSFWTGCSVLGQLSPGSSFTNWTVLVLWVIWLAWAYLHCIAVRKRKGILKVWLCSSTIQSLFLCDLRSTCRVIHNQWRSVMHCDAEWQQPYYLSVNHKEARRPSVLFM